MAERTAASQKAYQNKRKVLQIKAAKADAKERRAIDNQILRLDMEHAQSNPSVLDAPLKAVKKMTPGHDDFWFEKPEGMSHEVFAALNVAGDIGLDPLNAVGAGFWGKGAKAAQKAYAARGGLNEASKGMLTASADNYIPNFYVPDADKALTLPQQVAQRGMQHIQDNPDGLLGSAVKKLSPTDAQRIPNLSPEDMRGAAQRGGSLMGTLGTAAKNTVRDIASPSSRALMREHGISGEGQRIIQKNLKEGVKRGVDKAGAEAIYNGHQIIQAGGEIPPGPMKDFLDKAFVEWYQPNTKGTIKELTQKHAPTKNADGTVDTISDADAQFLEDNINKVWDSPETIVMKRAESNESGKHQFDLFNSQRNPSMSVYKMAMKDKPQTNDELFDALKAATQKNKMAKKHKVNVMRGEDGSVWMTSSRPGSAIVEGGYRGYHKVEPTGDVMAMMSDEHDFLEKAPVVGKAIAKAVPNRLLAISPPIKKNIFEKSTHKQAGSRAKGQVKGDTMKNDLKKIAALKPSDAAVTAERQRTTGMLTSVAAATNDEN